MQEITDENSNEEDNTKVNKNDIESMKQKNIYYTQFNINVFIFFIIFFILCSLCSIGLFIMFLNGNDKFVYYSIIPLIVLIFITLLSSIYPLFNKIVIDKKNELITITRIKILFCLNKYLYINMNDIELVSIEKNIKIHQYDAYNLIFKIKKDKKIIGIEGEIDQNYESQNLFEFMREALPKYIQVSSDLITINELYPNIKTNRVMSESKTAYINLNKVQGNTALDFE